jgi:CRISPR-associated protein Cmr6
MGVAAVPSYLGNQFSDAAPGHRFALYLPYWQIGSWQREPDKAKGKDGTAATGKGPAFQGTTKFPPHSTCLMKQLVARQRALTGLESQGSIFCLEAVAIAPFATGLGNEHPLENGFAFLNPYGLPYLPGSGIKGVLRAAARELAEGIFGVKEGWEPNHVDALFGRGDDPEESGHRRGTLSFWDVIPQIKGDSLKVDVMTPHQTHYYQNGDSPHDSGSPNPIYFLSVLPGSGFVFHIQCDREFLARIAPGLLEDTRWKTLLEAAFRHAFDWLGFGAKTAVGYGAMQEDPKAKEERQRREAEVKAENSRREAEARRSTLSPEDLAWEEHILEIDTFQGKFDDARGKPYQPGGQFDNQRSDFLKSALSWSDARSRQAAAALLSDTMKKDWGTPGNKDRRQRIKDVIATLLAPA